MFKVLDVKKINLYIVKKVLKETNLYCGESLSELFRKILCEALGDHVSFSDDSKCDYYFAIHENNILTFLRKIYLEGECIKEVSNSIYYFSKRPINNLSIDPLETKENINFFEEGLYQLKNLCLLKDNVKIIDSKNTYIDFFVNIGKNTTIFPNNVIKGNSSVAKNCFIGPNCFIENSEISNNVKILGSSFIFESYVDEESQIGPFAHIRPGSSLGKNCKIGNFVELKKCTMEKGSKASHLSYLGDAHIGEETNIGCGVITCNYDGKNKHKTKIGSNSFIGSDSQLIAPVNIGNESFVAAGSTITSDVPDKAFAIGRAKQETKNNLARKFLKNKK